MEGKKGGEREPLINKENKAVEISVIIHLTQEG